MKIENVSQFEERLRLGLFQCDTSLTCKSCSSDEETVDSSSTTTGPEDTRIKGINSMDISRDGSHLAVAVDCNSVALIDLELWTERNFPVKKYGIGSIRFLTNSQAIHTSTKVNNELRMIDFEAKEYVRYFKGHEGSVLNIDVSRNAKNIISSSADDRNVSLWDVSREKPVAVIDIPVPDVPFTCKQFIPISKGNPPRIVTSPRPVVAFDPSSVIFAFASSENDGTLKLFDLRTYSRGPFLSTQLGVSQLIHASLGDDEDETVLANANCSLGADFTEITFSPDGRSILLNTDGPIFYILCAMYGRIQLPVLRSYDECKSSYFQDHPISPQVVFTPDSKHVLGGTGSDDGEIRVWNASDGSQVGTIKQIRSVRNNDFRVNFVAHHPTTRKIITCGTNNIDLYRSLHLNRRLDKECQNGQANES